MDENIHFVSQKIYNCFLSCSISKVCHCKKFGHVHKILVIFIWSYLCHGWDKRTLKVSA